MKTLLIAGNLHNILQKNITDIVNHNSLCLSEAVIYIEQNHIEFDVIVITDDGMKCDSYLVSGYINDLSMYLRGKGHNKNIVIVTKNRLYEKHQMENCKIVFMPYVRIPIVKYNEELTRMEKNISPIKTSNVINIPQKEQKQSLLNKFMQKKEPEISFTATDEMTKGFDNISRGISRVVGITGHRGSGITSTAVNLAEMASKKGLSTILIDLDIDNRSINMYFGGFAEASQKNEEINASLIRNLAKPQDYKSTSYNAKDNLSIVTLSYDFSDLRLLESFLTTQKIISMISIFRQKFNLCVLDLPIEMLGKYSELLIHIDSFGICVSNNMYSVITTLRSVNNYLDKSNRDFLNSKSKIIVSKYNDKSIFSNEIFSPQKVCEMLSSDLSDTFKMEFPSAGHIPFNDEFDTQIETDMPIVSTNAEMEKAYGNILLRILEGVK